MMSRYAHLLAFLVTLHVKHALVHMSRRMLLAIILRDGAASAMSDCSSPSSIIKGFVRLLTRWKGAIS